MTTIFLIFMMKGLLITFEGIDFSGKSVQAKLLHEHLLQKEQPVLFLREPGGSEISEKIRELLLDPKNKNMTSKTELLLYSAARSQMVLQKISPHQKKGGIIICDRFYDSTTAYQGYGRQIDLNFIKELNNFVTKGLVPDLTFLIDLEPETALKRNGLNHSSFDRLEQEDLDFHHRVRRGYLEIARCEEHRFVVVDGEQSVEKLQHQVLRELKSKLQI